jgi:hypothetical protein
MYQHSVINHSDGCCGFPRPQLDGSGRDNDNSSSGSKRPDDLSARMVAGRPIDVNIAKSLCPELEPHM